MKMKNIYLSSLTSLAMLATVAAHANQDVSVPNLEGGITASVGTFFYATSQDDTGFGSAIDNSVEDNNNGDYNFGWQASLGFVFDETANSIELSYRGLDSTDDQTYEGVMPVRGLTANISDSVNNKLETADLMLTQFVDFGDYMQMRFLGGLSYLFIERKIDFTGDVITPATGTAAGSEKSKFSGFGPRVGIDSRYDFGGEGFGIVGGASLGYFLGQMKYDDAVQRLEPTLEAPVTHQNTNDNHNVTNLRANLGIDYVYYMDENDHDYPTFGIELGYLVDYYADAITVNNAFGEGFIDGGSVNAGDYSSSSTTFSGPYLNIKGAF